MTEIVFRPLPLSSLGGATGFQQPYYFSANPVKVSSSALEVMEKAATAEGGAEFLTSDAIRSQRWVWLLRALAYEPPMFDRSALLLARLCAANAGNGDRHNSRSNFEEVFHVFLSGTKAERLDLFR